MARAWENDQTAARRIWGEIQEAVELQAYLEPKGIKVREDDLKNRMAKAGIGFDALEDGAATPEEIKQRVGTAFTILYLASAKHSLSYLGENDDGALQVSGNLKAALIGAGKKLGLLPAGDAKNTLLEQHAALTTQAKPHMINLGGSLGIQNNKDKKAAHHAEFGRRGNVPFIPGPGGF